MKILKRLLRTTALIILIHQGDYAQEVARSCELILRVVSNFGSHVPSGEVVIKNAASKEKEVVRRSRWTAKTENVTISDLEAGRYLLEVTVPGFVPKEGVEVFLRGARTFQTISLEVVNPFHRIGSEPTVQVIGHVEFVPGKSKRAWLSFLGVYSGARFEIETDDGGKFSGTSPSGGVYIVAVKRGEAQPTASVVTLRLGTNNLVLE